MSKTALKLVTDCEKKTRTTVDTIMVTPALLEKWKSPQFQRPVRENEKVRALAEELKGDGGVWPGIVTLGIVDGVTYIVDGQHRKAAFLLSGLEEGYTDVRIHYFADMAAMGEEFVNLNSQLVRMRPDDILRGLEPSLPALVELRRLCPFVGYDQIRRTSLSPLISMSVLLRCWRSSLNEVPGNGNVGSAPHLARSLSGTDAETMAAFLNVAMEAFGRDVEYVKLWGCLNLTLCMWMYRRVVLPPLQHNPNSRSVRISKDQFRKCLLSLSANGKYLDWLVGRIMGDRDRSPGYSYIKDSFAGRLREDMPGVKPFFPQPSWAAKR